MRVEGKIKDPAQFGRIIVAQQGGGPGLPVAGRRRHRRREGGRLDRAHQRPAGDHARHPEGAGRQHRRDRARRRGRRSRRCKTRLPPDVELRVVYSTATRSRSSVNRVKQTIIEGALLTVLIVFLFLHSWRSTIITGLTLPIAVIATFIALYAFGFTLNFLTLMALSLCIGLLIDDAIVVRENIVRHLGDGQGPPDGGARGHRRDRPRGDGDHVRDRRRVRADRLHERHHRPLLLPVRRHRRGGGAGVAVRQLHARPDAVVGLARPAGIALQARAVARPLHGAGRARHRVDARGLRPRCSSGRSAHRKTVLAHRARRVLRRASRSCRSSAPSSSREADQSFISLRLNTPVGSSLEYTDGKVRAGRGGAEAVSRDRRWR